MDSMMHKIISLLTMACFLLSIESSMAKPLCANDSCCSGGAGGISYCDSSAGRYVCRNGDYSACYCTRHAVMGLEKLAGCCLWEGGVLKVDGFGTVICNSGAISEICGLQSPPEKIASW
jgi:hypothetical protein